MFRFKRLDLIGVYYLDAEDKLTHKSVVVMEMEGKSLKRDIIISVILTGILISLFFTRNIITFFPLFSFGLIIGIFEWIKLYKEREGKTMKRRRIVRIIERGIKFLKELLLGGAKVKW